MNKKLENKQNIINDEDMSQVTGGLVNSVPSSGGGNLPLVTPIEKGNGADTQNQKNSNYFSS